MRRGKFIQFGSGSLSRSQRKAEKVARRSQKRAAEREAMCDTPCSDAAGTCDWRCPHLKP